MTEGSDKIDMSLDQIIRKDGIRIGGRGGRGARRGSGLQQRSKPQEFRQRSVGGRGGGRGRGRGGRGFPRNAAEQFMRRMSALSCRLMVSNLAYTVTDEDLFELFASFGPLKKSTVHYDQFGKSLGTAELIFEMRNDAIKAMNQYNGVPLDGRPMRIRIIGDKPQDNNQQNGSFGGGRSRGFGGSFRGKFNNRGGRQRSDVTQEDLDKDLDNWRMETE